MPDMTAPLSPPPEMASRPFDAFAQQAALLELSDRFRALTDPGDLAYAAAAILANTLAVSRAGYGTIDPVAETITVERDWNAPGIESLAGVLHFRDYGSYIDDLKRGETAVVSDARLDPRTARAPPRSRRSRRAPSSTCRSPSRAASSRCSISTMRRRAMVGRPSSPSSARSPTARATRSSGAVPRTSCARLNASLARRRSSERTARTRRAVEATTGPALRRALDGRFLGSTRPGRSCSAGARPS